MSRMILRRMLQIVPLLFVISVISFALVKLSPGDPVKMFVTPNMHPEDVERIRRSLGLNLPIYEQYFRWLGQIVHGNLGYSLQNSQPVLGQILQRLPATIGLMGTALAATLIIAIPLGLVAAKYENTWIDRLLNMISYISISIPVFWFGILLIEFFSVKLNWLPSLGMQTIGENSFVDLAQHAILPVTTLTFQGCGAYYRYVRSNTLSEIRKSYVEFGHAKGLSIWKLLWSHILKNVMLPVITLLGMSLPTLISGAYITESVFSWPGLGLLSVDAIFSLDYPIIMAMTLFSGLMLILGNLFADMTYQFVDPRIRK
ncbi:ABC transporter permease [Sporolactobacillus laevolacticus]|uniref:Peptide ABC transporter permease n=1 Tax=Sporolactobacillus laevolacticus DSM 442 TaxID=1395513 RepID=V6IZ10_9BACL|nr:ABC transporter permease [Sporolactobacillus laevolacticus]EST12702.1 peptide ABC transporter permease [Sporolactobacillus laevolacticus DSM 442]